MLTHEKVLKVFGPYLDADPDYEVVKTSRGYTVLAVDQRSHGQSEGRSVAFGAREKRDAVAWAQFAEYELGSGRVWMHGVSIGAVSVLLALEDYYRTDPHWRQERLSAVAQAISEAMGASVPDTTEETLCALAGEFHGSYWGKTAEPLTADVLSYITSPLLEGCTVYDYETDSTGGVYDLTAAEKAPYDLFLGGPKALLRIENPAAANDRTLVVVRDSFGSSLIPLLAGGYRTVYAVDIRYISTDALARVTEFPEGADVLLLYSVAVLQNSITLK